MSKAVAIIGTTGTGKTTFIKDRIKNVNKNALFLYDVNKEYTDIIISPYLTMDEFLQKSVKLNNACIVFEEATIFFSNKSNIAEIRELLVRKRHTNNTIFFVFHSFRDVPHSIISLINYMIIFKTQDSEKLVQTKFDDDRLTATFSHVIENAKKDPHYKTVFITN